MSDRKVKKMSHQEEKEPKREDKNKNDEERKKLMTEKKEKEVKEEEESEEDCEEENEESGGSKWKQTPLMKAVLQATAAFKEEQHSDLRIIELLLHHNDDVNDIDPITGQFPLLFAANGFLQGTQLLLEHGAKVNVIPDDDKLTPNTPLLQAIRGLPTESRFKIVQILLKHGADPNLYAYDEMTPPMLSFSDSEMQIAELLVEHGAEINLTIKKREEDEWALLYALSNGKIEAAKLLIRHGADVSRYYIFKSSIIPEKTVLSLVRFTILRNGMCLSHLKLAQILLMTGVRYEEPTVDLLFKLRSHAGGLEDEIRNQIPQLYDSLGDSEPDDTEWEEEEDDDYDGQSFEEFSFTDHSFESDEDILSDEQNPKETDDNDMIYFIDWKPSPEDVEILEQIIDYVTQPKTLQQLCRLHIRCFASSPGAISSLPLPTPIRDYINYLDVLK